MSVVPGPKRSAQSGPASLPKKWLPARQQGEGAAAAAPRAELPIPPRSSWPGSFSLARLSTGRANTVAEARAALAALDAVRSRTCDAGAVGGRQAPGATLTGTLSCGRISAPLPVGTGSHGCRVGDGAGTAHQGSAGRTPCGH